MPGERAARPAGLLGRVRGPDAGGSATAAPTSSIRAMCGRTTAAPHSPSPVSTAPEEVAVEQAGEPVGHRADAQHQERLLAHARRPEPEGGREEEQAAVERAVAVGWASQKAR